MNVILLSEADFIDAQTVRIDGRRLHHVLEVHGARPGRELRVGLINGKLGLGHIHRIDDQALEMIVHLDAEPPAPLPVRLVMALPRPKVLDRVIASAASLGVPEIDLINSWRVEKAYWRSPRLDEEHLRTQCLLGLEQAVDTRLPTIRLHRLFTPFVREELAAASANRHLIVADPGGRRYADRAPDKPAILVLGPEGGFIQKELDTLSEIGFEIINFGPRILRVETALAYLIGRLFA